jgi:hypothetical protein
LFGLVNTVFSEHFPVSNEMITEKERNKLGSTGE